jgi:pimeloyl-ACP methyl ester carboxylesterase
MFKKILKICFVVILAAVAALAVFWFSRPADVVFDDLKSSVPHSQFSKFADLDGLRIHYLEKGEGTPLVLIHGYTSSTYTWKDQFAELAKQYRVIAVDLKGFGFSDKPDGDYSRRAQGEVVARLLDKLNIERAWLVGNSMGGETALNVAADHPEKVLGLVLIDSAGVKVQGRTSLAPWYLQLPVVGRLLTALALTSDRLVRAGLEKSFYDDSKITDERVSAYYQPLRTLGGQLSATRARAQFELFPVEDKIPLIKAPTLIIWGAEDELIPLEAGRKLNELITGSKLVVFDKCGHVPQEEMPERVLSEITGFVK